MKYQHIINEYNQIIEQFFNSKSELFGKVIQLLSVCLKRGNKILIFGNGGSAAQAQHFAQGARHSPLKGRPRE